MLFNLKAAFLLGLVAVSAASPTSLEPRKGKKIPDPLECDGRTWTKDEIYASIQQAKALDGKHYAYPVKFEDHEKLFNTPSTLWEFPLTKPVWKNGVAPNTFRVIVKDDFSYFGVTNKDVGTGNTVHKC